MARSCLDACWSELRSGRMNTYKLRLTSFTLTMPAKVMKSACEIDVQTCVDLLKTNLPTSWAKGGLDFVKEHCPHLLGSCQADRDLVELAGKQLYSLSKSDLEKWGKRVVVEIQRLKAKATVGVAMPHKS
eukprot:6490926-Amphidinium_carterae.1